MGVIFSHSMSLECAQLQFKPRLQGFHLTPIPQVHFGFLFFGFFRPLWFELDKPLTVSHGKKTKQNRTHIDAISSQGSLEACCCFCLHFVPSVIHTDPLPPPPPPSLPQAPGLACVVALGIHVSRPIDLLSFFKVRS